MHNDAKFGLIVGVVLVLAIAVLFFPKEGIQPSPSPAKTAEINAPPSAAALLPAPTSVAKPKMQAQTTSRTKKEERTAEMPRTQR